MVSTATPRLSAGAVPYGGIATRALALGVDAALANAIVLVIAALLALVASLVGDLRPQWVVAVFGAAGWIGAVGSYFALFWTTTGQTPGMRLMGLRVVTPSGTPLGLGRALLRLAGLALAIIPFFAGFVPVLFDSRRRALQDWLAGTVVVHTGPDQTLPAA